MTTTDDSGDILISFPVDTSDNHTYTFDLSISAVSVLAGPVTVGAGWKLFAVVVTDGTAGTANLVGVDSTINFKSVQMATTDADGVVVGAAFNVTVTGLPANIPPDMVEFEGVGYYTQIG